VNRGYTIEVSTEGGATVSWTARHAEADLRTELELHRHTDEAPSDLTGVSRKFELDQLGRPFGVSTQGCTR
jgi:hypothetical protein